MCRLILGRFASRWSVPVEGELLGLESTGNRVYAALEDGSNLEVMAFDLDGGLVWQVPARTPPPEACGQGRLIAAC
jgi:hypothetical protein